MKSLITALLLLASVTLTRADTASQLTAVQAADDARVAAMRKPTQENLGAIFSDELRYSHSTGAVDTKASFTAALTQGKSKYLSVEYEERNFTFPAPGIALMSGRAKFNIELETGPIAPTLAFLAVWRLEEGKWRFLAWQSCKLPTPAAP
ncbi:MAG: nuclear transport factor 2 family protein [Verrucomicrobiales bacterium]|nr:nuclear transport factor 2 family protein [Verrucomicrobiae bacterium]MCP5552536.1 nuclear transport factor 2 family protein [Akkermansiaceae bacterium]